MPKSKIANKKTIAAPALHKSDWNEKFKRAEKDFKVAFAKLVNSNEYKKMIDRLKRIGAIR